MDEQTRLQTIGLLERCAKSNRLLAKELDEANPGDRYAGLLPREEAAQIDELVEKLKAGWSFVAPDGSPWPPEVQPPNNPQERLDQAIAALERAQRALHGAWQMFSAICETDASRDRLAARDRALAAWERSLGDLIMLRANPSESAQRLGAGDPEPF